VSTPASRARPGGLLTAVALALTLATAYVHLTLGGWLFTLNAAGYLGIGLLMVIGATVPHPVVERFAWLPPVALGAYAVVTILAYLIVGPYFALGWITKAVEVALVGVVAADLIRAYGSAPGVVRAAIASLQPERRAS
jgi:hypothetical protein